MVSSEGKRWTLYLDKRAGEPWWKVRWGDSPREGAEGYEVVEVAPASEVERLEKLNRDNVTRYRTALRELEAKVELLREALEQIEARHGGSDFQLRDPDPATRRIARAALADERPEGYVRPHPWPADEREGRE